MLSSIKSKAIFVFSLDTVLILMAVSRAILLNRSPMRYFDEGGFITWLSFLQLLFIGYLCYKIGQVRFRQNTTLRGWENPGRAWQMMMVGFIFLAMDEYFQIHERLDKVIQGWFGLGGSPVWERIDDFIILLYAILGLLFLRAFWKEIKQFSRSPKWFLWGFLLCFVTIALDMLSHNSATMASFVQNAEQLRTLNVWLKAVEEMAKIFAEGAFIVAFEGCLMMAKSRLKPFSMSNKSAIAETEPSN